MREYRFGATCVALCIISFAAACTIPTGWPDENPGYTTPACSNECAAPRVTEAIIGFPWEKVDFGAVDGLGYYTAYVAPGDSVTLYFASRTGADVPQAQLDTVRSAYWVVSVQPAADTSGPVYDARGDTTVAVMERRGDGRGVLKPRKSGYILRPLARVDNRYVGATVYSCRGAECVKVTIVSR